MTTQWQVVLFLVFCLTAKLLKNNNSTMQNLGKLSSDKVVKRARERLILRMFYLSIAQ